ncbi:hypothetical protein [Paraburkholderia fungorum]|uniref:hypothetical protein n=1 Tax=Paraburkholderia fungorum TaxID=134537 RepID=UPI001C1EE6A8|nr:hypothetical protein [Paraburkholderia fungorum]MBU7442793.1 hypothetical protein [Paraburkholderia fungorum]
MTHVEGAIGIIDAGKIRAQPISGDSELKDGTTKVVWFSPNAWLGSIYGNIAFRFDFASLLADHDCYFVEEPDFGTRTFRYLITDKKYKNLQAYNPAEDDGPWWMDREKGEYFYGESCTIQFIVDMDVPVHERVKIDFVAHNHDKCIVKKDCAMRGWPAQRGGAHFFMHAVARAADLSAAKGNLMANGKFSAEAQGALDYLRSSIVNRASCTGKVQSSDPVAAPLARAILNAFANGLDKEGLALAALFRRGSLRGALDTVLGSSLGIENLDDVGFKWDVSD